MRKLLVLMLACLPVSTNCGNGTTKDIIPNTGIETSGVEESGNTFLISAKISEDAFLVELPDGTVYTDIETYTKNMPNIVAQAIEEGYEIDLNLKTSFVAEDARVVGDDVETLEQPLRIDWGNYVFTVNIYRSHRINGCVGGRRCRPAVNIRKHEIGADGRGQQLWDWHAGVYSSRRDVCLGIYQSEQPQWCNNYCFRDRLRRLYVIVRDSIYDSLVVVGVSAGTAWVIAELLAPVAAGALAGA